MYHHVEWPLHKRYKLWLADKIFCPMNFSLHEHVSCYALIWARLKTDQILYSVQGSKLKTWTIKQKGNGLNSKCARHKTLSYQSQKTLSLLYKRAGIVCWKHERLIQCHGGFLQVTRHSIPIYAPAEHWKLSIFVMYYYYQ